MRKWIFDFKNNNIILYQMIGYCLELASPRTVGTPYGVSWRHVWLADTCHCNTTSKSSGWLTSYATFSDWLTHTILLLIDWQHNTIRYLFRFRKEIIHYHLWLSETIHRNLGLPDTIHYHLWLAEINYIDSHVRLVQGVNVFIALWHTDSV